MNLQVFEQSGMCVFDLSITRTELERVVLHPSDRLLIAECQDGTLADKLLALELLVRRIQEQAA